LKKRKGYWQVKRDFKTSKTLARLSGPGLFNLRLFFWSYLILFIPQVVFDVVAYESSTWLWLFIWTGSHLLVGICAYFIRVLWLDNRLKQLPSAPLNLIVASVLGVIRVTTIGYISFEFGLAPEFNLVARIISGAILGTLVFALLASIISSSSNYQAVIGKLLATQRQMESLRRVKRKEVTKLQRELEISTRAVLEPKLEQIARALNSKSINTSTRRVITKDLRSLLDNQVKPLSARLRSTSYALSNPNTFRAVSPIRLLKIPDRMKPELAINPLPLFILMAGVVPFSLYVFQGQEWIPLGFGIVVLNSLIFQIYKLAVTKRDSIPTALGILVLLALIGLQTWIGYLILTWANFPTADIALILLMISATLFISISGFGLVATYEYNQEAFLKTLAANNNRLERELALLNQRLWVEKREWALRIHGTVQASLTASIARLSGMGLVPSEQLKLVRQHIQQARKGLSSPGIQKVDLVSASKAIRKTWAGLVKIAIDFRSTPAKLVIADKWASVCANEIIKESVSNAVKHGKADEVTIRFESSQPGFVEIVVEDNGRGLPAQFRPGLGSEILDEIAFPWSLSKKPEGGTLLRARLPVSRKKAPVRN